MKGTLDEPPIVLRGRRAGGVWMLILSAIFIAGGFLMLSSGQSPAMAILIIGFFGLIAVFGLVTMVSPARLEIGPTGLVQKVLWRTTTLAWADVHHFRPAKLMSSRMVGFDYVNGPPPERERLASMSMAAAGVHGALPTGWEVGPNRLSDLLNEARRRWHAATVQVSERPAAAPVSQVRRIGPSPLMAALTGARLDRKSYWIAVGVVFALAVVLSLLFHSRTGIGGMTTFLFVRIFGGRLQDVGKSPWWQLFLWALVIGTVIPFAVAKAPVTMAIGAAFLVQIACTLVLGLIPGTPGANRFGPASGQPSPLALAETFR